jgi:hypothetical protein
MIKTDFSVIKSWQQVPIQQLGELLKSQGFSFVKSFSTDEHRIFVNQESTLMIIFERNVGKVYSTRDRKNVLHTFNVIQEMPKLKDVKRPE